jgi:hypothetical protein
MIFPPLRVLKPSSYAALLHFNGTDAATTFTDVSGRTWTAAGNAQLDTAQKKFGTASGLFDGTGDYITVADSTDFTLGTSDFTIDFWIRKNADGAVQRICGQTNTDTAINAALSVAMRFTAANVVVAQVASGITGYSITSTGTITADAAWHHVAFVRDTNTLRLFIAGVADGTADVTGVTVNNSSNNFSIGRQGEIDAAYFNGWIDEFRFSVGKAFWTSNFTPPTGEY